jgi:hypothetical protein
MLFLTHGRIGVASAENDSSPWIGKGAGGGYGPDVYCVQFFGGGEVRRKLLILSPGRLGRTEILEVWDE